MASRSALLVQQGAAILVRAELLLAQQAISAAIAECAGIIGEPFDNYRFHLIELNRHLEQTLSKVQAPPGGGETNRSAPSTRRPGARVARPSTVSESGDPPG